MIIDIATSIANWMLPEFDYKWIVKNWRYGLPREVDFNNEAKNSKKCKYIFWNRDDVWIPDIIDDYSSDWVITMSFEEGISVGNISRLQEEKFNLSEIATKIS